MLIEPITTGTAKSDVVSALKQIERIEKEAEQVILHEEKMPFYAFTATSRASLAYWYDNLTDWSALRNDVPNGRFIFIDWFRVMIATASDAAGAAAGAAIRAAIRV